MTKRLTKSALAVLATGTCLGVASAAQAQSAEFSSCATLAAAACIEQVGNGNAMTIDQRNATGSLAVTFVKGDRNGLGTIAPKQNIVLENSDDDGTTLLSTRAGLEGGTIKQQGSGNVAIAAVIGYDNKFHIGQTGNGNIAAQAMLGRANSAAIVQDGVASPIVPNAAVQVQAGVGNYAYAEQIGQNNIAVQVQVGPGAGLLGTALLAIDAANPGPLSNPSTAEAMLQGVDAGTGNSVVLKQTNSGSLLPNTALLLQAGDNNSIALQQNGGLFGSFAAISQFGDGHSVAVNQQAGTLGASPIVITQF
jgi:hypothetical protein